MTSDQIAKAQELAAEYRTFKHFGVRLARLYIAPRWLPYGREDAGGGRAHQAN